jgi:hypothetical protein
MRTSVLLLAMAMTGALAAAQSSPAAGAARAIPCRALEVHTDAKLNVTIVVFHQRDDADRDRVGALLRTHDGEAIGFRTSDGASHSATLLRLKSCFGRGLLLIGAGSAHVAEKDEFLLTEPASGSR